MSRAPAEPVPYWRLSAFYLFYFMALGAFLPYWALYLQSQGYDHVQIGIILAILPATKIISPNVSGWLADRTDRSVFLIRISSWLTAAGCLLLVHADGFWPMVVASSLVGLFWNAPLPLFEAVTLAYLRGETHRYSQIRLWGSLGFIIAVASLGAWLEDWLMVECLPQVVLGLFVAMSLVSCVIGERSVRMGGPNVTSFRRILAHPEVLAFMAVFLLVQVAHGPYYTFFSVYLKDHDYDPGQIGLLWSVGVVAEVLLFIWVGSMVRRIGLRRMVLAALLLGVVRWALIAWCVDSFVVVLGAQTLHAATFGVSHVAAIHLVNKHFSGRHQGKGQALYSSFSFGMGGMAGSYLSGLMWDGWGAGIVFSASAGLTLAAFLIALGWIERPRPPTSVRSMR